MQPGAKMEIETSQGRQGEATPERISEILRDPTRRGDFIILSQGEQVYLQACAGAEPCHVEYRDGGSERHFYAKHEFTIPELEALMLRYLAMSPDWDQGYEWAPLSEFEAKSEVTWDVSW